MFFMKKINFSQFGNGLNRDEMRNLSGGIAISVGVNASLNQRNPGAGARITVSGLGGGVSSKCEAVGKDECESGCAEGDYCTYCCIAFL